VTNNYIAILGLVNLSQKLSVVCGEGQQRRARCGAWCEDRDGSGDDEECCDEAVAVSRNTENREKQARDVSRAEWRSTGR